MYVFVRYFITGFLVRPRRTSSPFFLLSINHSPFQLFLSLSLCLSLSLSLCHLPLSVPNSAHRSISLSPLLPPARFRIVPKLHSRVKRRQTETIFKQCIDENTFSFLFSTGNESQVLIDPDICALDLSMRAEHSIRRKSLS